MTRARQPAARRCCGNSGTALVEFAFVSVLLLTIVFAIINFGLILSFKQDMTRAAAEGARAAAVAFPAADAVAQATTATEQAVAGFNKDCVGADLQCLVRQHDCDTPPPDSSGDNALVPNCVTVELIYDYENHPLLVPVPLIAAFLPDEVRAKSSARVNK